MDSVGKMVVLYNYVDKSVCFVEEWQIKLLEYFSMSFYQVCLFKDIRYDFICVVLWFVVVVFCE